MDQRSAAIRVTIPYKAANDLSAYKKAVGSALEKLGCGACCSGLDIYFDTERYFRMDKDFKVAPVEGISLVRMADPAPVRSIGIDAALINDRDSLFKTIDKIADLHGCQACCSGLDLFFQNKFKGVQVTTFGNGF